MKAIALILTCLALSAVHALAQSASLRGRVLDESGAVVPGAAVHLRGKANADASARPDGSYAFANLAPGDYSVTASAPQLATPAPIAINLRAGANALDIKLSVAAVTQQVTVDSNAPPGLSVDPSTNVSATILSGADLDALSDDPQDLADDLAALAGPSAGPNGGAVFVDGFSGGQLPPKESIREIRINANPFSPEYDKLGLGRIEIFTKPGTDKFHASVGYNLGTDVWNSRNPYSAKKADFLLQETENSFSGSLNKRTSFTLDFERQSVDNGSITNAVTLDPNTLAPVAFLNNITTPQRHTLVGPHIDYQINQTNTLSVKYLFTRADIHDFGIGSFDLTSRGYHLTHTFDTAQISETSIHGALVNETRFQFFRHSIQSIANLDKPETQVLGSFNDGGASVGHSLDIRNDYEFQNYTTTMHGAHTWHFGARLRGTTLDSTSPVNFNGTFTFTGGLAPELDANNQPLLDPTGQPILTQITSIEQYRRTLLFQNLGYSPSQIRALGGGASQFTIAGGRPELTLGQFDAGIFFDDQWRARPNLTFNFGLRFESQTNISDHADFAPRIAVAWAPGGGHGTPKTVIRGGFGMFYDRFPIMSVLNADRYNGVVQQQYVVTNPDFYPNVPALSSLASYKSVTAIQEIDAHLRTPYTMQTAITLERQLPKRSTLAVTYTNTHAVHVLRLLDINPPLPGTYNPNVSGSGVYPYPGFGPIFLNSSSALYNQNQLIVNVNSKLNPAVSLFGYYILNRAMSSSDGFSTNGGNAYSTVPGNPYNYAGEYGPAATDARHRVIFGGSIFTRWNLRFNPFVTAQTGIPFDITSGTDPYGTSVFTARPGIVTDGSKAGLISTPPYGPLDPNPTPGEKVLTRNFGRGPGIYSVNLRVGRTWGFGPEKGGGVDVHSRGGGSAGPVLTAPQNTRGLFVSPNTDHRYNLTVAMSGRNLFNHTNPGPIIGNITSPLFGRANQMQGSVNGEGFSELADNRRLELQIRLTF